MARDLVIHENVFANEQGIQRRPKLALLFGKSPMKREQLEIEKLHREIARLKVEDDNLNIHKTLMRIRPSESIARSCCTCP